MAPARARPSRSTPTATPRSRCPARTPSPSASDPIDVARPGGQSGCATLLFMTRYAVGVAVLAAILQYTVPGFGPALQRDPTALAHGEWWRLVSPLFVQTLGWYQVLANLVTLALFGVLA